MTLPRKLTRPIVVDDIRYRWMLKETDYGAWFELLLVVEAADSPNGEQLSAHIQWRDRAKDDAITPAVVAAVIGDARGRGWDFDRPGSRVDCDKSLLELVRARLKPVSVAERTVYTSTHRCTRCGGAAQQSFAEELGSSGLSWWESWHCAACGDASEADGRDRLSDDLRDIVVRAEGSFRVDVVPRDKMALLRVLRDTFSMSLAEAKQTYAALPYGFRTGLTRKEAEWVASRFGAEVADTSVVAEQP